MDKIEVVYDSCELATSMLFKFIKEKNTGNGELTAAEAEYMKNLLSSIMKADTIIAMEEGGSSYGYLEEGSYARGGGNSRASYRSYARGGQVGQGGGNSGARGRGRNARRDSMGRYSRDNDEMIMELRELMEDAPDEETRMEFQKFIQKVEKM